MHIVFDVVDLLQLQELWSWRPIVTAFSRLERRETPTLPGSFRFEVGDLVPRLARLRLSPDWRARSATADPARSPIRDLSDDDLACLYPDGEATRQALFCAVYRSFSVARYEGSLESTRAALRALVEARRLDASDYLDSQAQPRQGAPDWIPADITDEIRGLDCRYSLAEPGTPSAYVIADSFWMLLAKAVDDDLDAAAGRLNSGADTARQQLTRMTDVARVWNRSPSVVGLCYQVMPQEAEF